MKSSVIRKCINLYQILAEECMEILEHLWYCLKGKRNYKSNLIEQYSIKPEFMEKEYVKIFLRERENIISRNRYRMTVKEEKETGNSDGDSDNVIGHVRLFCKRRFIHQATLVIKPDTERHTGLVYWKFD